MNTVVFGFPGNEPLTQSIIEGTNSEKGVVSIHRFPDDEWLVRIDSDFVGKEVVVVATLDHPDTKILPLYFLCKKLKVDGAVKLTLVSPYLPYMRQDKSFHEGEVVSSVHFASWVSSFVDQLITVDPHLHRHRSLREIFSVPCFIIHSSGAISSWITKNVKNPVLIGPDSESRQWVAQVASSIDAPYFMLSKQRLNDRAVKISFPDINKYLSFTPVIVDDIISTAHTMIETVRQLRKSEFKSIVCIGVHALFVEGAYEQLLHSGVDIVTTCNSVPHVSNKINLNNSVVQMLNQSKFAL